jgi:hypothetical protein
MGTRCVRVRVVWPKALAYSPAHWTLGNGRKTGFQNSKIVEGFWPVPESGNVSRLALCPGFHARSKDLPLQMRAMREYAAKGDWTIAVQMKEVGSGASERELRERLLAAARRREIDVVLVWRLDRWGRSLVDLVVTLKELAELGVAFVSRTRRMPVQTHSVWGNFVATGTHRICRSSF